MRALLLSATGLLLLGCSKPEVADEEPLLRPVRATLVTDNPGQRQRALTGIARSAQASRISFRVGGTVVALPVQVGDRVADGELIARLNSSNFDLAVQQSEASLAQALASQRNADASYSRVKELYANNNASRNDLDSARASAESAEAQVRSARKALEIAKLERSYTQLRATGDCTIASLDIELNENVSAGNPVAQVNCGEGIEVRLGVPESLIGGLNRGMSATTTFSAIVNQRFAGTLTEVGTAGGNSTATFPVVVTLNDPSDTIRPGMAAEVTFEFDSDDAGIVVIPAAAVVNDERGSFVYLAEPTAGNEARISRRDISVGELRTGGIEVTSGLTNGDRVVTAGVSVIRDGQTVLLPQELQR
ncbi:MAG: efflux RND transporter periplasmic adaptor subunit [Pseudomonadota bacterium]